MMTIPRGAHRLFLACGLVFALAAPAAAQTLRIAFIDPLSGPFALTGEIALERLRQEVDRLNRRGLATGERIEVIALDNRASAQESIAMLAQAVDRGARYVVQGQGSGAAAALIEAVNRHNERNPGRELVFLNYAAIDPVLTNARCSFWHFRFDPHVEMRMEALTGHLAAQKHVRRVHLVVQDYSFGHEFARHAREMLARKRPDIQVVGEERHPLGQVRDFAPYAAKIRASGADAVLTGNWGNDLNMLVRAAREAGLTAEFYTFYATSPGALAAMGEAARGRVHDVNDWHPGAASAATREKMTEFAARSRNDFHFYRLGTVMAMFERAVAKAGSSTPVAVARALGGLRLATDSGEVTMRALDHQLVAPLYVAGVDAAGRWRTVARIPDYVTAVPTSCRMTRP